MNSSVTVGTERSAILASHPDSYAPSRANPFPHIRFGVLVCLVGALASGCIFSPKKNDDGLQDKPPIVYSSRSTPEGAVRYLSQAWTNRDSVRIDSVYADDYLGSSVDLTDPNSEPLQFSKSDEFRAVHALGQATEINYIIMDLKSPETWTVLQYASDPPEWRTVQIPNFTIEVRDINNNGFAATSPKASETWIFEFTLRPTYPAWANGLPVWEIVKWVESRDKNF